MAALNASFAGAKVTKAAKKVRVSARAMKPVRAAVAAPADVSADTVQDCVNTIRFLAIDAINKSNSRSLLNKIYRWSNLTKSRRNWNDA